MWLWWVWLWRVWDVAAGVSCRVKLFALRFKLLALRFKLFALRSELFALAQPCVRQVPHFPERKCVEFIKKRRSRKVYGRQYRGRKHPFSGPQLVFEWWRRLSHRR